MAHKPSRNNNLSPGWKFLLIVLMLLFPAVLYLGNVLLLNDQDPGYLRLYFLGNYLYMAASYLVVLFAFFASEMRAKIL
jgi:antibiotic biosynthesis monooxygenase (ABM) superfamily enzyme